MLFNFCLILALYDISHAYYGRKTTYDCQDKQDDGYYEHEDCHKYWHCLYVGTIFQNALERKCPIGTMFHPLQGECEISTFVSHKLIAINLSLNILNTQIFQVVGQIKVIKKYI